MRIPDWLFGPLERVYRDQARIRRQELSERVEAEDRRYRALCAREMAAHDSGMCGGAPAGCRYFPCYSVRGD